MVKVKIIFQGKEVPLPIIQYGSTGSFTDYTKPGTEIILVAAEAKNGAVFISKSGYTIEHGQMIRELVSVDLQLEKEFTNVYHKKFISKHGPAELILQHVPETIN